MSLDITNVLFGWPYEAGQVAARRIEGDDGTKRIQLRLDLGLLQMEVTGRPDGQRPHGYESLLAYYEHQVEAHKQQTGSTEGFTLDERACELLRAESMMYYHRYLASFVLEDHEAVERDTMRNLRVMDFCNAYAEATADRYVLDQYRPYVLMMCARARGQKALRDSRPKAGLAAVNSGIDQIEAFYKRYEQEKMVASSGELAILRALAKEIEARIPVDPLQQLHDALETALGEERYEDAAALRDKIRQMGGQADCPAGPS